MEDLLEEQAEESSKETYLLTVLNKVVHHINQVYLINFNYNLKYVILLVLLFKEVSLGPELFSPPHFRIQGGGLGLADKGQRTEEGLKSLCLIMDY